MSDLRAEHRNEENRFCGHGSSERAIEAYERAIDYDFEAAAQSFDFGPVNKWGFVDDPKRFGFLISRHKFVSKMLDGKKNVLDIGCQEGLGTMIVSKAVARITGVDFFAAHVESANKGIRPVAPNAEFFGHDIIGGPVAGEFDAAYSMDVFEHIDPAQCDRYMKNIIASLTADGVFIVGIPSLESQAFASPASREGHINCRTGADLRDFCREYFGNVFMFGMNDEVVHTGFFPMCHYLIAVCVGPKSP
ncbi:MAG: class I SAM-dependent methyltransferase [Neomegalonema sp.]|nr:class I SAM-dependent methyltransferase [Neomegalonema sp.]